MIVHVFDKLDIPVIGDDNSFAPTPLFHTPPSSLAPIFTVEAVPVTVHVYLLVAWFWRHEHCGCWQTLVVIEGYSQKVWSYIPLYGYMKFMTYLDEHTVRFKCFREKNMFKIKNQNVINTYSAFCLLYFFSRRK